jgi:tol-pal system protein YbgF
MTEMRKAATLCSAAVCLVGFTVAVLAPAGAFGTPQTGARGSMQLAQLSASDLVLRIERLEAENRRLTGLVEQLQYRNQQLEQQLRGVQGAAPRSQGEPQARGREPEPRTPSPNMAAVPPQTLPPLPDQPSATPPSPAPPAASSGRHDVFDPTQSPNAPGAPRTLGTLPATAAPPPVGPETGIGAPGGREAGAPLDLSSLSGHAAREPPSVNASTIGPTGNGFPPRPQVSSPPPVQTVMAPSATPRDEYDLAYGYVLHKDYALAAESFRAFLKKYPADRLVPDANYWLGESLFQRQRYRDAAESFLAVSTKYETAGRAPDALLRLGQSLAALGEKDAACATFNEVGRKYPRASLALRQGVEREQKRAGC